MTERVPELAKIPRGLVLDGELVAVQRGRRPHWPLLCERVLHGNTSIPVTFVAFEVLRVNGHDLTANPWASRRAVLEEVPMATIPVGSDVSAGTYKRVNCGYEMGVQSVVSLPPMPEVRGAV